MTERLMAEEAIDSAAARRGRRVVSVKQKERDDFMMVYLGAMDMKRW